MNTPPTSFTDKPDLLCLSHLRWKFVFQSPQHLKPSATVFDCMDELSAFQGAPATLKQNEEEMFRRADIVFTGGHRLYEAKKEQHHNVHAFPSSVDVDHFRKARTERSEPADQA